MLLKRAKLSKLFVRCENRKSQFYYGGTINNFQVTDGLDSITLKVNFIINFFLISFNINYTIKKILNLNFHYHDYS